MIRIARHAALLSLLALRCASSAEPPRADVLLHTSLGDVGIRLYEQTPEHRANFLRLAGEGFFDSLRFHRIVYRFMVQSGDPRSRGQGFDPGADSGAYTLPAEIRPEFAHVRGQLGAARRGDAENPERRSSGTQFYIVTGQPLPRARLDSMEQACLAMIRGQRYQDYLAAGSPGSLDEYLRQHPLPEAFYTPAQRKAYLETGGAPWLDQAYTLFGEVVSGMEVLLDIELRPTNRAEQPLDPVWILSAEVLP